MKNLFAMMKDAASLQRNVKKMQADLRQKTVEFSSGKGEVTAVARGDGTIAGIRIEPSAIRPGEARELERLVLKAVEGAQEAATRLGAAEMKSFAAGMGLPNIPGL